MYIHGHSIILHNNFLMIQAPTRMGCLYGTLICKSSSIIYDNILMPNPRNFLFDNSCEVKLGIVVGIKMRVFCNLFLSYIVT